MIADLTTASSRSGVVSPRSRLRPFVPMKATSTETVERAWAAHGPTAACVTPRRCPPMRWRSMLGRPTSAIATGREWVTTVSRRSRGAAPPAAPWWCRRRWRSSRRRAPRRGPRWRCGPSRRRGVPHGRRPRARCPAARRGWLRRAHGAAGPASRLVRSRRIVSGVTARRGRGRGPRRARRCEARSRIAWCRSGAYMWTPSSRRGWCAGSAVSLPTSDLRLPLFRPVREGSQQKRTDSAGESGPATEG